MNFDSTMLAGFFDELETIQKEAGPGVWSALGEGLGKTFTQAHGGLKSAWGAIKGPGKGMAPDPNKWGKVWEGAKQMAPAAAVVGAGGLATYGAGKAAFGN